MENHPFNLPIALEARQKLDANSVQATTCCLQKRYLVGFFLHLTMTTVSHSLGVLALCAVVVFLFGVVVFSREVELLDHTVAIRFLEIEPHRPFAELQRQHHFDEYLKLLLQSPGFLRDAALS